MVAKILSRNVLVPALLVAIYAGCLAPLIPQAADDVRMADVFSVDEAGAAVVVRHLHGRGSLELETFSYGGLFYYIPLGLLQVLGALGLETTDRMILLTMRSVCLVAGAGCLWLTWLMGTRVFGFAAALAGTILLVATPTFLRWSVEIHPDLPQLFWVLCGLLWILRLREDPGHRAALLAGLFAGLAAGTKYAGAFLMPLVAAALFLPGAARSAWVDLRGRLACRARWSYLGSAIGAFLGAFALSNPYALVHLDRFRADVAFEKSHLGFGHMFRVAGAGLHWLSSLGTVSGRAAGGLFVGALLLLLALKLLRRRSVVAPQGLLLLWVAGYIGYLVVEVNLQAGRHLLPILPVMLLFAGLGIQDLGELAVRALQWRPTFSIVICLLIGGTLWQPLAGSVEMYRQKHGRAENRAEIAAGLWIANTFPEDTSILFDAYSYVPGRYVRVYRTFGMSYPLVNHFQPELLVVRDAISGRYGTREDAEHFRQGEDVFLDRHYFYGYLEKGRIPEYERLKDYDGVTVYRRRVVPNPGRGDPERPWLDLVKQYGAGSLYGLPEARMRMGGFHADAGDWEGAAREYRLVTEMIPAHSVAHYSLAQVSLRSGRVAEAEAAFGRALELVADRPDDYRATVRLHIARLYVGAGLHHRAIGELTLALDLNPSLADARFDLGACHLLLGDRDAAEATIAEAVRRHGRDPRALSRLRELCEGVVGPSYLDDIAQRYFGE